jgi:hypothetical protein
MQLSDLDWRVRTALAASGIVFFFLVGLGAGTYFDRTPTDSPSEPIVAATSGVTADHSFSLPAPVTTGEKTAPAPEPTPAPPSVAQARAIVPPPLPPEEMTGAPPQAVTPPAVSAPAPREEAAALPPPVPHTAAPTKLALAAPPRPEAKPAPVPAAVKPVVLHPPTIHPPVPADKAGGPFRIQFGVFRHEKNARRLSEAVSTPAMKVSVIRSTDHQGHPLYYVRSPNFPEFARALAAAWDAQNAAQKLHFNEPIPYLIQRVPAAETAAAPSEATELAAGAR